MPDQPMDENFFSVNFDEATLDLPMGVLLLKAEKMTPGMSNNGNRKIDVQLRVMGGEDDKFNKRVIFDTWLLETAAVFRIKNAARAFLGKRLEGSWQVNPQDFLDADPIWCLVDIQKGEVDSATGEQYQDRSRVKRFGVKAPVGADARIPF